SLATTSPSGCSEGFNCALDVIDSRSNATETRGDIGLEYRKRRFLVPRFSFIFPGGELLQEEEEPGRKTRNEKPETRNRSSMPPSAVFRQPASSVLRSERTR